MIQSEETRVKMEFAMRKEKNTNGFTLIELLVVISIIALLLGILMPALNKARTSAQALICATNLKNYGVAMHAYAADNREKAPYMTTWLYSRQTQQRGLDSGDIPLECRWHEDTDRPDGSLWPYMADKNVHLCPTFKRHALRLGIDGCPNRGSHSRRTRFEVNYSYSMNWFVGFDWQTFITMRPPAGKTSGQVMNEQEISMKLSRVSRTGECFAFSEENLWTIGASQWDNGNGRKTYNAVVLNDNALWLNANKDKPDAATDNIATYHKTPGGRLNDGEANLVFVDGHAESMRGVPGRGAYETYGKPYRGHDNLNIW